jgi:hypothetical protein
MILTGTRFGPHKNCAAVVAGGMGEVRAPRDARLNRNGPLKNRRDALASGRYQFAASRRDA